jgi:hypothetical protein
MADAGDAFRGARARAIGPTAGNPRMTPPLSREPSLATDLINGIFMGSSES